jgi:predicted PurR-regulated permease PerM
MASSSLHRPEGHLRAELIALPEPVAASNPSEAATVDEPPAKVVLTGFIARLVVVLLLAYSIYFAKAVLLPIVLAVLFSLVLSPAVRLMKGWRIHEAFGAALVVGTLVAALVASINTLAEPAAQWFNEAPRHLNQIEMKVQSFQRAAGAFKRVTDKLSNITRTPGELAPREVVMKNSVLSGSLVTTTQSFLIGAVSTLVLLYFLLASGDAFLRKLLRVLPRLRHKVRAVEVTREIQHEIGQYFLTITCINAGLGAITGLLMNWLGLPNPLLWAVMVGVLNFVPYVGPGISLVVLTVVALATFDRPSEAMWVPGVLAGLFLLEGQLLQPLIVGKRLALNAVMVFLSFLIWGWLWGIAGLLIAVPLLVVLKICCDHIESWAAVGEFLSPD